MPIYLKSSNNFINWENLIFLSSIACSYKQTQLSMAIAEQQSGECVARRKRKKTAAIFLGIMATSILRITFAQESSKASTPIIKLSML